jgi:hypothetical protein
MEPLAATGELAAVQDFADHPVPEAIPLAGAGGEDDVRAQCGLEGAQQRVFVPVQDRFHDPEIPLLSDHGRDRKQCLLFSARPGDAVGNEVLRQRGHLDGAGWGQEAPCVVAGQQLALAEVAQQLDEV